MRGDLCLLIHVTSSHSYKHRHYLNRPCHQILCSVPSDSRCKCPTVLILFTPAHHPIIITCMQTRQTQSTHYHLLQAISWVISLQDVPVSQLAAGPAAGHCHVKTSPRVLDTRVNRVSSVCRAPWGRDIHCPDMALAVSRQSATQVHGGHDQTLLSLGKKSIKIWAKLFWI